MFAHGPRHTIAAIFFTMFSVLPAFGKPPELPGEPAVEFKLLSPYQQDFHQGDHGAAPLAYLPAETISLPPSSESIALVVRVFTALGIVWETLEKTWWTEQLFEMAEIHYRAEDYVEASRWYNATRSYSPNSHFAVLSTKRLDELNFRSY